MGLTSGSSQQDGTTGNGTVRFRGLVGPWMRSLVTTLTGDLLVSSLLFLSFLFSTLLTSFPHRHVACVVGFGGLVLDVVTISPRRLDITATCLGCSVRWERKNKYKKE